MNASLRRHATPFFLALATLALLLPFINKPIHVDDPTYLWPAQQIRLHPLDPYGFKINWYATETPMYDEAKNPPVISYYLAAASCLLGWSEPAMHAALLLPAIGVILGTYHLARQLNASVALAAATTLATPVFLVSATTLMCDVLMLCFFVWAVYFWVRGMREDRAALLIVATSLATLAALSKYFGVALLPMFLVHGMMTRRRPGIWLVPLVIPLLALAAWQLATKSLYGRGLLFDAAQYATQERWTQGHSVIASLVTGLAFTGGCCATVLLVTLAARARTRGLLIVAIAIASIGALLTLLNPFPDHPLRDSAGGTTHIRWLFLLQLAVWTTGGAALLAFALAHVWRDRSPDAVMLTLWVAGTFAFAALLNWSLAARSVLPIAPAAAIIVARSIPASAAAPAARGAWRGVALGAALALLVAVADASFARTARDAAALAADTYHQNVRKPATLWFTGHWGFQEYMQRRGARVIDQKRSMLEPGDGWVEPSTNSNLLRLPEGGLHPIRTLTFQPMPWACTIDPQSHAGFYSDRIGPLPFALGPVGPQNYRVSLVIQPMSRRPK